MASDEETQAYGQYVNAEDVLDNQLEEDDNGESEDDSEDETDDDDSETASETETESGSGTETASESEPESSTEDDTETESEATETERTTTGMGDVKSPRHQQPPSLADEGMVLTAPSAEDAVESLTYVDETQPLGEQQVEGSTAAPAQCSLPPATSRSSSREGTLLHQTTVVEDAQASADEPTADEQDEPAVCSLPPAVSRNSSRECSRKSSHCEASTSESGLRRSSSSLPPINVRSGCQQPSRKGSSSSSQAAAKRSQASSPQQGSPSRNPIAAPRYFQPPAPPPPPPKPKPRERHDTSAVDPMFLQTAVYRTVPNVGRVYDWKLQHEVNAALSKQRKQQAQMEKVLEAARLQLQVREANARAFQQWVAAKDQEKQQQYQQNRRIAYVTSVYQNLVKEDPVERKAREALWVSNFAYTSAGGTPPRLIARERVSEDSERFRL
ncbi:hypothetical protein Vretimale_4615 [Volvox reticuliferus]|uniref:Uncharacterized protein n=1 Tax=Volvox reticuliferus TaxID=1737510 RepID=A0A8J4C036_9CHLO|nr:hypothetical protein Vretifemale_3212 [Volvox reticuliferus]GIL99456.1 hypothetical protein Vretimale_4615 [Volvox reticuliferus]